MKKFKKITAMCLAVVMAMSVMSIGALADVAEPETDNIQFVETDKDGNVIDTIELVYLNDVAEAYEQSKIRRWASTSYYNLGSGPLTMSGDSAMVVQCRKHFNANSSGRLYYHGEVTDENASVDIYDITNRTYKGSFVLRNQGDGVYSRTGYVTGLNSSSSQYYSFGLTGEGTTNFTSYYTAISWTSL